MTDDREPAMTDLEIIALLRKHPPDDGIRRLIAVHGPIVLFRLWQKFEFALKREDREEILNDAAYQVWRTIDRFDSQRCKLVGWFWLISDRLAITLLRQGRGRAPDQPLGALEPADEIRRPVWCVDDDMSESQSALIAAVCEIIEELPEQQRSVAAADVAAGERADDELLAERLNRPPEQIRVVRNRYRRKIEEAMISRGFYTSQGSTS